MKKIISIILALILLCVALPFTAYAADDVTEAKRTELASLHNDLYCKTDIQGELHPYSKNSFTTFNNAMKEAEELLREDPETVPDWKYQNCIDYLNSAFNNMCVDVKYAKQTYVLSLDEHNRNGFYDENDWNDFSSKRDALRDSFKTNNEFVISYAFFELQDSFINMTSHYKAGDVNNDNKVDVDDVTLIQKYIAGMEEFTRLQSALSSNLYYGQCWLYVSEPNIDSATYLQKGISGLDEIYTNDFGYGSTYTDCYDKTYNSLISLCGEWRDDRYESVNAKVAELEAEGII